MRGLSVALGVAYPALAHWAVYSQSVALMLASTAILLLLPLLPGLLARRAWAWIGLLLAAGLQYVLWRHASVAALLFVPPVAINLFLAWLFASSLAAGGMPLIERAARLVHGNQTPLEPRVIPYTRRLTAIWTILFAGLALINGVLAMLATPGGVLELLGLGNPLPAPLTLWSWFANVFNYLLVGALFVLEYAWRRRVFPQQPYRHFGDFLQRLIAAGPTLWRQAREKAS